ncbi:cyclic nucleotide-gated channel [Corchorus olitorius]|uniref:Cyclic nucleotide-gated channel n=1 Tax=Corchorus olitorius TaxID=93759 RepID=A0A1R3KC37_9ROSI|nr:cyclic nucleotide-gated channel [Corchorus olitorius]
MASKNQKDHWAFLEEIEAPMWVDLTLEAELSVQDIDDDWFLGNHLFHQCSSQQLKSAFSRSAEEGISLELDLVEAASSPGLPRSVSRSRGKDYQNKKWKRGQYNGSSNKIQPVKGLNGKFRKVDSGPGQEIKPKLSYISLKSTASSKTSLASELTENVKAKSVKPVSMFRGPARSWSPMADKSGLSGETNTRSTVTSENVQQQQQQKFFEVSSRGLGQTSGLLSSVRLSLRKSCITRPASRVEINADRRDSRDHKSSSGKSSVGSSSFCCRDVKKSTIAEIKRKEQTPDSRNVARMTEAAKIKMKPSNMCNTSNVRGKDGNRTSRVGGGLTTNAKPSCQEATKSKANSQTLRSKQSLPLKNNQQKSLVSAAKATKKVGVGRINKVTDAGKENIKGELSQPQKCNGRGLVVGRKETSQSPSQNKSGRTKLVAPKGRVGNQREVKNSTNFTQRVYFR